MISTMSLLLMSFWMFSFSTSPFALHHLNPIHLRSCHVSCSMLTPSFYPLFGSDVRFVPRYIAARSLFRWFLKIFWFFFFLRWKDALDIIISSSVGRKFSPLLFFLSLSLYLLPLPTTYLRRLIGPSISHHLDAFSFYGRVLLLHYLQKVFSSLLFLIKFQIINSDFLFLLLFLLFPPFFFRSASTLFFYILYGSC